MSIKRTIIIGDAPKKKDNNEKDVTTKVGKSATIKRRLKTEDKKETPKRTFKEGGKTLIIVESPAKSKTIEKFLGSKYKVYASMGHLRDLPKNTMGVDVENNFEPRYDNILGRKKIINELCAAADEASSVLLATDPDREGEAISWHLAHILNLDKNDKNRITFNEITKNAVNEALGHARTIDMNMVDAQQARRILDRLVGYKLSPLLWKKICKGLSAGRVQSVAIRLIVEREREIEAFIPEEYWSVEGLYEGNEEGQKKQFSAQLAYIEDEKASISTEAEALAIKEALMGKDGIIKAVETRKRTRKPAPPFTTSTLQQEGVRKLNFGAKKTMMLAQHLYEGMEVGSFGHVGLITYMRTDSTRIAKEMQDQAKTYIEETFGKNYYPEKANFYGAKESSQDAHEAIRPTSLKLSPDMLAPYLGRDELRLYKLIWNRFLASQMAPQLSENVTMVIDVDQYKLKASGSKVIFPGFTEVYDEGNKEEDCLLPILKKGDIVTNLSIEGIQHFTQPPARFTEASLIKTLEEKGIGRPSTYAPILDTIMGRNYVEKEDKVFKPTELGYVVVDFLVDYFDSIINVNFTAHLETVLDDVADGKETYTDALHEFYDAFEKELIKANDVNRIVIEDKASEETCDLCGSPMVYKFGRFGKFLACSNFPDCTYTKPITIGTGVTCPKCKVGEVIERKSKRGRKFYGCSNYPNCDFVMWDKPNGETCSVCHSLIVEKHYKNGTTKKFCSNDQCPTRPKRKKKKTKEE